MITKSTISVVKSNRLVEARHELSLIEQQIILYSIYKGREYGELTSDTVVSFAAREFGALFEVGSNVYALLESVLDTLDQRRFIFTDKLLSGNDNHNEIPWLTKSTYIKGVAMVEVMFSTEIISCITRHQSKFTVYKLEDICKMTSAYAVRLYELLVQYLSIGKRTFDISELKHILELEDKYSPMCNFKKRVIDVAVEQINLHSNLIVTYTQLKLGRKVKHLVFDIKVKEKAPKPVKATFITARTYGSPKNSFGSVNASLLAECGAGVTVTTGFGKKKV